MSESVKRFIPPVMGFCAFLLLLGNLAVLKSFMPNLFGQGVIYVSLAVVLAAVCAFIKRDRLLDAAPVLTVILFLSLIALPFSGLSVNGACRWFRIGGVYFAPAAFAMPVLCLFWTWFFKKKGELFSGKHRGILIGLFIPAAVLIFIQPSIGMGRFVLILAAVLYCLSGGSTLKAVLVSAGVFIIGFVLPLFVSGRFSRIFICRMFWCNSFQCPHFQTHQLINILKNSVFWGPHQAPDNIIGRVIAAPESALVLGCGKFGFAFLIAAVLLMLIILAGAFIICRSADDPVDRLLTGGMAAILFLPFITNLLTMFGILPPGSIGFPLLAYGGSALLSYGFVFSFFFGRKNKSRKINELLKEGIPLEELAGMGGDTDTLLVTVETCGIISEPFGIPEAENGDESGDLVLNTDDFLPDFSEFSSQGEDKIWQFIDAKAAEYAEQPLEENAPDEFDVILGGFNEEINRKMAKVMCRRIEPYMCRTHGLGINFRKLVSDRIYHQIKEYLNGDDCKY